MLVRVANAWSRCGNCRGWIHPDEVIGRWNKAWEHASCLPEDYWGFLSDASIHTLSAVLRVHLGLSQTDEADGIVRELEACCREYWAERAGLEWDLVRVE